MKGGDRNLGLEAKHWKQPINEGCRRFLVKPISTSEERYTPNTLADAFSGK